MNLSFRPATPDDWAAAAYIVEQAPDGELIHQARWDSWATDSVGALIAALDGDRMVGFSKLSQLGDGEWWLEGLRADPEYLGEGIRSELLQAMLDVFQEQGHGILRFASSSGDVTVANYARQAGFRHTTTYGLFEASRRPADYQDLKILQPHNLDMVYNYVRNSPMYRVNRFVEHNHVLYYLTHERLAQLLADDQTQVLGWRQAGQLYGVAILFLNPEIPEGERIPLYVGYLTGSDDTIVLAMLVALRGLVARWETGRMVWKMPLYIGLDHLIETAQLARTSEEELWLFELPIRLMNP